MSDTPSATSRQHETKQALLAAGALCFAQKGFQATGVREICVRAKANPAAINYHFGGKMEFYRAVLLHEFDNASPPAPELGERAGNPEQRLRKFIHWFTDRMLRNQGNNIMRDILNHELREPTGALRMLMDHSMRPICDQLERILADLLGVAVDDKAVKFCSISIFGQCLIYKQENRIIEMMHGPEYCSYEAVDDVADYVFRFTLSGLQAFVQTKGGRS
ncbi:MAG: CerR family C-terminal domain-containing protein [Verrucomicrobiota bacterium]